MSDGTRALFLRSDGPEDTVTSLWMSWFDDAGQHHETLIADPRVLLGSNADSENVPAENAPVGSVRVKAAPASSAIRWTRRVHAWCSR